MALGAEEILGRKHVITSLLKLRMSEEMTQSELNEYISNWKIVRDRVDLLREGGLVEERLVRDGRMVMKYRLSPRGKFVSNLLLIMDMTLKGRYEVGEDGFAEIVERIKSQGKIGRFLTISTERAARESLDKMFRGKATIVSGISNKFSYALLKFIPESVRASVMTRTMLNELRCQGLDAGQESFSRHNDKA